MSTFRKQRVGAPPDFFSTEAHGLRWLADASGAPPLPEVLSVGSDHIELERIDSGRATEQMAADFGRALAAMHRAGAPSLGADWPGFIGPLPMDNTPSDDPWHEWYAARRVLPFLRQAYDAGAVSAAEGDAIEACCVRLPRTDEPPARIHGDLWSGNLVWAADGRVWLIDPAAHGGHRETDLAMLALFGAPHLDRILAAYDEAWPLADGWRDRVGLHQLHPLLVHAVLFGGSYGARAAAISRAWLRLS